MCLWFVLTTTLWGVKLHSKERNEDSDRRCLYTGEDHPSVERLVWIRIWISGSRALSLQLGLIAPQGHKAEALSGHALTSAHTHISPKEQELGSTKRCQRKAGLSPWAVMGMWWDEQRDGHHAAEHRAPGSLLIIELFTHSWKALRQASGTRVCHFSRLKIEQALLQYWCSVRELSCCCSY